MVCILLYSGNFRIFSTISAIPCKLAGHVRASIYIKRCRFQETLSFGALSFPGNVVVWGAVVSRQRCRLRRCRVALALSFGALSFAFDCSRRMPYNAFFRVCLVASCWNKKRSYSDSLVYSSGHAMTFLKRARTFIGALSLLSLTSKAHCLCALECLCLQQNLSFWHATDATNFAQQPARPSTLQKT